MYSTERSTRVKSHLCGLIAIEPARSQPAKCGSIAGKAAVMPRYAASTCSQMPRRAVDSATLPTGSTALV